MLRRMRAGAARFLFAAVFAAAATVALAQHFPAGKQIERTVMFGAGSAADVTARTRAEGMSKELGAPVVAVNRPGSGGAWQPGCDRCPECGWRWQIVSRWQCVGQTKGHCKLACAQEDGKRG